MESSMRKKRKKTREAEEHNYQTISNLPFDLTSLIMSYLLKKDNIRASSVCKTWHEACVSVRVEDPKPWLLLYPPYNKETYELYDPSLDKTYTQKLPSEFRYSYILHSTDGWLLIKDLMLRKTFFFNPFTHDIIPMPCSDYIGESRHAIAFSSAPTSNNCVIFAICNTSESHFTIKTCCVSTKVCASFTVPKKLPRNYGGFKEIVFSNRIFYCLTNNKGIKGNLGMFDLSKSTWDVLPRPRKGLRSNNGFLTEYQGDIFLIYVYKNNLRPKTYLKLDLVKQEWRELENKSSSSHLADLSFMSSLMVVSSTQVVNIIHNINVWIRPPAKSSFNIIPLSL